MAEQNGWLLKLIVGLGAAAFVTALSGGGAWLATENIEHGKALSRIEAKVTAMSQQIDTLNRWILAENGPERAREDGLGR